MDTTTPAGPAEALGFTPPAAVMQGFDTFSGSGRATAIAGETRTIDARNRCDYTVCTSTEKLMKALSISASFSAEFGFGGIDAKADFVQKLEATSTSVVIAIYANVVRGTTVLTNPRLANGVKPPDAAGLNSFFQSYGDSYISAMTEGGEYIATYVFYSQTSTQQQDIVASLKAHGVGGSGSVSGSLSTAISQVSSSETVRVSFSQQLLGFHGLRLPTEEQVIQFALDLSAHEPDSPHVVDYDTEGYEHAPGMNADAWRPVVATRDLFLDETPGSGIAWDVDGIDALQSQIGWLQQLYRTYGYTLDSELASRAKEVEKDAATLRALIRRMQKDPTQSYAPPTLATLAYGLPVLNVTTPTLVARWGGDGGSEWWDVTMQTILDGARLNEVRLVARATLDRITSTYGDSPPVHHGGDEGSPAQPLVLEPREFVSTVSGRSGTQVDHLKLTTTRGQEREAGGSGGGPFSWTVPAPSGTQYTVLVGFGGRSGATVDAIGPMTATFSPATWQEPSPRGAE